MAQPLTWGTPKNDHHTMSWTATVGAMLNSLLRSADYDERQQKQISRLFSDEICPMLGSFASYSSRTSSWHSFVVDSGIPIELSWDWNKMGKKPQLRVCFEPVGQAAGTLRDPLNQYAASACIQWLRKRSATLDGTWFETIAAQLLVYDQSLPPQAHSYRSRFFIGLDFQSSGDILAKAYFATKFRAARDGLTDFEVMQNVIHSLSPQTDKLQAAFAAFERFHREYSKLYDAFVECLSVDCFDVTFARIKIYVRCPNSSWNAVRAFLTLDDRLDPPKTALQQLFNIWASLQSNLNGSEDWTMPRLLYNVELQNQSSLPKVKIYLPLQDICPTDLDSLGLLEQHFATQGSCEEKFSSFKAGLIASLGPDGLNESRGLLGYISCSLDFDGLNLTSYIHPRQDKLIVGTV